jgi:hypothetical protein
MAKERVDRARKMVRRINPIPGDRASDSRFRVSSYHGLSADKPNQPNNKRTVAENIYRSTRCTANPSSSSILTGHISRLCVFSTNASVQYSFIYLLIITALR